MTNVQSSNLLCVVDVDDDLSDWESPVEIDLNDPPVRRCNVSRIPLWLLVSSRLL